MLTATTHGFPATGTVVVARTADEVERLRPVWESLAIEDMDADPDFVMTVVSAAAPVLRPHVVHVDRPGRSPLVVVARLVAQEFPFTVGYRTPASVRATSVVVAFEGFLGVETEQDAREALAALRESARGEADVVVVQKTRVDGPVATVLHGERGAHQRTAQVLWTADLPDSWDELLGARTTKSRRQLRYDDSKVRKRLGDRMRLQVWDGSSVPGPELDELVADLAAVAASSYQHALGVSLSDDPVQLALLRLAGDKGWLRVYLLHVDGRPAAFWWGIAHHGTLTIMSPGFDPEFAAERVGHYTLRRMLEALCADAAVGRLSFGPGDAEYKQRFGTSSVMVADIVLRTGGARGLLAIRTARLTDAVNRSAHAFLTRRGSVEEWRKRLRAGRSGAGSH